MSDNTTESERLVINKKIERIVDKAYPLPEDGLRSDLEYELECRDLLRSDLYDLVRMANDNKKANEPEVRLKRIVSPLALAVDIEGDLLCLACAWELSNETEYTTLFWMSNKPKEHDGHEKCDECDEPFGTQKAENATEKITRLLQQAV